MVGQRQSGGPCLGAAGSDEARRFAMMPGVCAMDGALALPRLRGGGSASRGCVEMGWAAARLREDGYVKMALPSKSACAAPRRRPVSGQAGAPASHWRGK